MAHSSFGPPWPNCVWSNMVTLVRADGLRLPVHRELVGLTTLLLDLTEMHGYDVLPGQTWGFACRPISGTSTPSNHSQGTADDLNAPSNPYASADWHRRNARGTRPFGLAIVCDIPQQVVELWEAHGYRWGGRYISKPDPMHFEFMGTVANARVIEARLRAFLSGEGSPPPPPPPLPAPTPPPSTLEYAMDLLDLSEVTASSSTFVRGRHVDNLQGLLIATWAVVTGVRPHIAGMYVGGGYSLPDGIAGPATKEALLAFQRHVGLTADAVCGPKTWKALIEF